MNIDNIETNDKIVLDNNKEYIVVGKALYYRVNYLCLINIEDYSLVFAAISSDRVILLNNNKDKIIIDELIPLFLQNTAKSYLELYGKKNNSE